MIYPEISVSILILALITSLALLFIAVKVFRKKDESSDDQLNKEFPFSNPIVLIEGDLELKVGFTRTPLTKPYPTMIEVRVPTKGNKIFNARLVGNNYHLGVEVTTRSKPL